jgi:hypothetical protein
VFHVDKSKFVDRLTHRLASVNILYVKIFQAIALNNSLIDEKINNTLLKFTDNAPWTQDDIDVDTLNSLKEDQQLVLCDGVYHPIKSGMISLVFKATRISDDSSVIIKIKRRMIERKLEDAIDNLMFLMYILSFSPLIKKYQFSEMVNKCIDGDFAAARPMHEKFLPIINSLFAEGSPSGVKAYLNEMGIVKNTFRLPVVGVGAALKERIKMLMETFKNEK